MSLIDTTRKDIRHAILELREVALSPSIRDNDEKVILTTFSNFLLIKPHLGTGSATDEEIVIVYWETMRILISLPELDSLSAALHSWFSPEHISELFGDIIQVSCTMPSDYKLARGGQGGVSVGRHICCLLHWLYSLRQDLRPFLRTCITKSLLTVGSSAGFRTDAGAGPCKAHVAPMLELLLSVLQGVKITRNSLNSLTGLVQHVLLPLHCPNEMVEWRTQIPVIQAYHPVLVKCLTTVVQKEREWTGDHSTLLQLTLLGILGRSVWPSIENANNIKELLLLQELESLLKMCSPIDSRAVHSAVLNRVCDSCGRGTQHVRVIQRALLLLKDTQIIKLLLTEDDSQAMHSMSLLVHTLFRNGEKSWNPSVNRMTAQALSSLEAINKAAFEAAAGILLESTSNIGISKDSVTESIFPPVPSPVPSATAMGRSMAAPAPLPPREKVAGKPLPWYAARLDGGNVKQNAHFSMTVTGVAPWAQQRAPTLPAVVQPSPVTVQPKHSNSSSRTGMQALRQYMTECIPVNEIEDEDENRPAEERSWIKAAQAVSPTLQPDMRFHDLVFGQDLGSGAFSTVRYARHICRDRSRNAWPEYAVKVISAQKIAECKYTANVEREMAILHLLTHPCIARLVSTFRYKECAYLVLEYATGGDLHSLVMRQGKLTELGARFVTGEVAAGLLSVHELGIAYMDLKPENVLATASGHIKITDFGGARPLTPTAMEHVQRSKGLLKQLRNGDWKDEASQPDESVSTNTTDPEEDFSEDKRIEGTPGYMAPEVLQQGERQVGFKADAWSLGCLAHFLLHGRPLFYGDRDEVLRQIFDGSKGFVSGDYCQKKVRFAGTDESPNPFDEVATNFISALLEIDTSSRMSVNESIEHSWLTNGGSGNTISLDPQTLHTRPPPIRIMTSEVSNTGPVSTEEDGWKRRQLSVLIAPMPSAKDYTTGSASSDAGFYNIHGVSIYSLTAIAELSDEAAASYL